MAKRKRLRPNLKDYLRTGIVQTTLELETDTIQEMELDEQTASVSMQMPVEEPEPEKEATPVIEEAKTEQDKTQEVLSILAPEDRQIWEMMIGAGGGLEVTHTSLTLDAIREEFSTADLSRFTYYLLPDVGKRLIPVQNIKQLVNPARCVLRWDENGAASFFNLE